MRTFQQQRNYERLEQLPPQVHQLATSGLRWLWEVMSDFLESPSKQPRVRQRMDGTGNIYWQAYDPIHDLTLRFDDEQAMLIWLDKQLYREPRANLWNMG